MGKTSSPFEAVKKVVDELGIKAKLNIVLVLDVAKDMEESFRAGVVGDIMRLIFPIGVELGVESKVDQWWFTKAVRRHSPLTLKDYQIPLDWDLGSIGMGKEAVETFILQEVIESYKSSKYPTLVFFISGGCPTQYVKEHDIRELIYNSSIYPIFWQFINLEVRGKVDGYDILKNLHEIFQRYIDNTAVVCKSDIVQLDFELFYKNILKAFVEWYQKADILKLVGPNSTPVVGYPSYADSIVSQMDREMFELTLLGRFLKWVKR